MGFHGFCLPLSLIVATHQLRTYSDPGSKCSIATNRSNPPPPDRKSLLSSPPHPQSTHASSPCARRAEAWPRRGWDGGLEDLGPRISQLVTNEFGPDGFAEGGESIALVLTEQLVGNGALNDFCVESRVEIDLRKAVPVFQAKEPH